jgi:mRNA-degrading endonuclease RelE of RelBE toxin-antitoxin system
MSWQDTFDYNFPTTALHTYVVTGSFRLQLSNHGSLKLSTTTSNYIFMTTNVFFRKSNQSDLKLLAKTFRQQLSDYSFLTHSDEGQILLLRKKAFDCNCPIKTSYHLGNVGKKLWGQFFKRRLGSNFARRPQLSWMPLLRRRELSFKKLASGH